MEVPEGYDYRQAPVKSGWGSIRRKRTMSAMSRIVSKMFYNTL